MQPSSITDILFQQLNFRGERQKVISTNIANIDTPGYKTKELRFEDQLQKSKNDFELKLATTHQSHLMGSGSQYNNPLKIQEVQGLPEQNDGNNVNLDTQMSEMSKNDIMFQALKSAIKKDSAWFKTVIESSGKN
jgi:flagellar basal-body rod protein FlgB